LIGMSMESDIREKRALVVGALRGAGSALVAFSGGTDSSLLLALAKEAVGEKLLAVTARSALTPRRERAEATLLAGNLGVRHRYLDIDPLADAELRANTPERCYLCKRMLLMALQEMARAEGLAVVVDGSNVDDDGDYRPGRRAVAELGVCSPFVDAGLTKHEIRRLSREMGLPTWDKPAMACLASRVPYGDPLDAERLARIDEAEEFLRASGFRQVRVRDHGSVVRLEVPPDDLPALIEPAMRARVTGALRAMGFAYVALDLEGYRTGALNRTLGDQQRG
jgi:uncharacterized protein